MGFELNQDFEMTDPNLVMAYGDDGLPHRDGEHKAGEIRMWIRPLLGGDEVAISDSLISLDKKGKGKVTAGTSEMVKATRSVTKLEGLDLDGKPVSRLSEKAYKGLRKWMAEKVKEKIAEVNAEAADDAE